MFDGTIKKVEDIKKNDLIMGDDSTPRKVLNTTTGKDIMYEIKNVKGEVYTVNSYHILSLKYSNKKRIFDRKIKNSFCVSWFNNTLIKKQSKLFSYLKQDKNEVFNTANKFFNSINENLIVDISIKDYLNLNQNIKKYLKGYAVPIEFIEKELEFDPYILGLWLGDGSTYGTEITNKDSSIIKYLKNNLSKYNCYLSHMPSALYGYNICTINKHNPTRTTNYFKNILDKFNLINNKHIPLVYKCNSRENRLKLLAGLIDTDGSLIGKSGYEFSQGLEHEQLIDDVIYLCRSLGFSCYKNIKKTSWTNKGIKNHGTTWRICIYGNGIEEIPVLCPRKKTAPRKQIKDVLVSGITVTELPEDNYYGFELDGNHRFILDNFIVTHNSNIIKTIEKHITVNTSKTIYLCATTGVSAYNIGGMTIHSFMGMGTGEHDIDFLIKRVSKNKQARDRISMTNILVIDEISMLSAELFEKINILCQVIRKNNDFFGGIQIVFSGDLLQLLPVFKNALNKPMDTRLIIESPVFLKMFDKPNTIVLTENFRQKTDTVFTELLQRMRNGKIDQNDISLLNSRKIKANIDMTMIQLVSSNKKAQIINQNSLKKIKEPEHVYNVQYIHDDQNSQQFNLLINELEKQLKTREMEKLVLKRGCRIMLLRNIDVKNGLINGSIGTIIDFKSGLPEIRFDNDIVKVIETYKWDLEDPVNKIKVSAMQLPLMLAYSCTIHKTQGLTLENAILDLDDCFAEHQVFVALSRLRSLSGLYLKSFDQNKIIVNKKMFKYLNQS
jgi:hypothetical protein